MHNEIPYIETLPSHWKVIQNRFLFYYDGKKVGDKYTDYQLLSLTTEGVKEKDISATGGKVPASYDTYQTVKKGQMIFCLFDLDCSAVFSGISHYDGMITSAYDVFSSTGKMENGFADYWFRYVFSNRYYKMFSKSIRYTITGDIFRSIKTPVPPLNEQRIISEYLNHKCSQIDALIANTGTQIAKLKQYKQSLITEAVTKGLDPTVPMKDSGVEWIGKIPESWSVSRVKNVATLKTGHTPPTANANNFDGEINWYTPGDFYSDVISKSTRTLTKYAIENEGFSLFPPNTTLLIGIGGTAGKVCKISTEGYSNQQITAIIAKNGIEPDFLFYEMIAARLYLKDNAMYTTLPIINNGYLGSLRLVIPPIAKQVQIASNLNRKCMLVDKLVEVKQSKIEKLEEYKKSLIYEYVTGKKEVEHG